MPKALHYPIVHGTTPERQGVSRGVVSERTVEAQVNGAPTYSVHTEPDLCVRIVDRMRKFPVVHGALGSSEHRSTHAVPVKVPAPAIRKNVKRALLGPYSATSAAVFNAAVEGFVAGVFLHTDLGFNSEGDFSGLGDEAALFAQEVDTLLSLSSPSLAVLGLITSLSQSVMANRYATDLGASAYRAMAEGIVNVIGLVSDEFLPVTVPPTPIVFTATTIGPSQTSTFVFSFAGSVIAECMCVARITSTSTAGEAVGDTYASSAYASWKKDGTGTPSLVTQGVGLPWMFADASMQNASFAPGVGVTEGALAFTSPPGLGASTVTSVMVSVTVEATT